MTCEEILKLIRATKTFNINKLQVDGLLIERGKLETPASNQVELAVAPSQDDLEEKHVLQQEIQELENENLLISDPEEYEKRVGNV